MQLMKMLFGAGLCLLNSRKQMDLFQFKTELLNFLISIGRPLVDASKMA